SRRVVSMPTVVVFPAPLGPSRPNTSPSRIAKDSPSTALTSRLGYRLTSSTTSTAIRPSASAMCSLLFVVGDDHIDEELADDLLGGRVAPGQRAAEQLAGVAADRLDPLRPGLGEAQPDDPPV